MTEKQLAAHVDEVARKFPMESRQREHQESSAAEMHLTLRYTSAILRLMTLGIRS